MIRTIRPGEENLVLTPTGGPFVLMLTVPSETQKLTLAARVERVCVITIVHIAKR